MADRSRQLAISAVAERYAVPASTLRYWEQIGVLPAQQRRGGQRRYGLDAVRRIKFVKMAKRAGLSLDDIRTLLAGHVDQSPTFADWAAVAREQLDVIDQSITELRLLRDTMEACLECGCQHARRCKLLNLPDASDRRRAP
ncbi:MAG: MerR family transcriptional regulator [Acidimicrobiales bacterium]